MKTKTKTSLILIAFLVVAFALGFCIYKNYKAEKLIAESKAKITDFSEKINNEQDQNKQFELLNEFIQKTEEYKNKEKHIEEISVSCSKEIKSVFKEKYNTFLSENALTDIESITDKSVLNSAI